uniref:Uncharacterized protein n=1 Tax=Engystomops pustulosus TaxID=76066 RepID=A0AAV6Z8C3_ENGPU|nr:hypothetical protein GDO81_026182 [Engystomops pustulosus]
MAASNLGKFKNFSSLYYVFFFFQLVASLLAIFFLGTCYAKKHIPHKQHHRHNNQDSYCFSHEDLENSPLEVVNHFVSNKVHWERYSAVNLVPELEDIESRRKRRRRDSADNCPDMNVLLKGRALNERSISPWSYRIDIDEKRFPQKLAFAQCLCNYCISSVSGKQNSALNSVPIYQTMLVLRRRTCPTNSNLWTFTLEYLKVPVACTCSVPRN